MKTRHLLLLILMILFTGVMRGQTKVQVQIVGDFSDPILKSKLDSAAILIEEVVNSEDFKNKVTSARFLRKRRNTNEQILELIRSGKEEGTEADNIINLKVDVYDSKKREIGHTDSMNVIHTLKSYILENDAKSYASHLLHEYCHVLGFRHAKWRLPFRNKTVPYKVGEITFEILKVQSP